MLSVKKLHFYRQTFGPKAMDYMLDSRSAIVTLLTVFTIVDLRTAHARQCYVCGIGPSDPLYATMMMAQHGATSSTSSSQPKRPADCSQFEHADADADAYLVECPAGYMGCFTQSGGIKVIRTCNRFSINDCKTANNITYCYCNQDRCNGKDWPTTQMQSAASTATTATTSTKRHQPLFGDSPFDDDDEGEDDYDDSTFESSGHSDPDTATTASTTKTASTQIGATTTTTDDASLNATGHNYRSRLGSGSVSHAGLSLIVIIPVCLTAFGLGI